MSLEDVAALAVAAINLKAEVKDVNSCLYPGMQADLG